ncbi:L-threonine O-3-phosphate decarboxylase [Propionispira arboris]|uniref:threonine-phosphate decarboxylase n=1 Tax=Propionispira arboris TaxID=84035 RepID=A0A1H6W0U6_9FIRM|nr:threonine-phosphate decarboxylase CobD [Propionispira arboris]SEJ10568.1 L-threonine O-3-phosphate decarboxylase [Propionispira arboris]
MDSLKKFEHGGNIHDFAADGETKQIIDFSANINPLGMSEATIRTIQSQIKQLVHYPDPNGRELKTAIAKEYQIAIDTITLGNGAVELLYVLSHILKPNKVLLPVPSFSEYERAAIASGAAISYFYLSPAMNFTLDWNLLLAKLKDVDLLFLGNPNNPTGNLLFVDDLERCIVAAKKENCFVVIDESFIDFRSDAELYTCRHLVQKYDNLLVLQSLTKFYAIPGLRLGFAITNPKLVAQIDLGKDPWNVNHLAQKAGVAGLADISYKKSTQEFLNTEISFFYEELCKIQFLQVYRPSVNFILLNLANTNFTAAALQIKLLENHILIRDCSNYPGLTNQYIRIAVKTHQDNCILLNILQKIIRKGDVF